jgi:hypothetical protein
MLIESAILHIKFKNGVQTVRIKYNPINHLEGSWNFYFYIDQDLSFQKLLHYYKFDNIWMSSGIWRWWIRFSFEIAFIDLWKP